VSKDGSGDFDVIQEAIDYINAYEAPSPKRPWVVKICPGEYIESLTGADSVSLVGIGGKHTVIVYSTNAPALTTGAEVQILITPAAKDFVTPLTLSTLSEHPVLMDFFNSDDGTWSSHVDLGMWADMVLIAPASANTMAKMAGGITDNLLLATVLSTRCKVFFAPAMDLDMYKHPTTTENIKKLQSFGYELIKPVAGELASGLVGCGRLEEPEIIVNKIEKYFNDSLPFSGKKVMITAGPTYEPIDPVRFIGNYSSGRMGIEIAKAMAKQELK